ncbi:ribonuclease R [Roseomonas elaeocarpi]|uniref:Ribonuclease R n=1 Tax=Roseomonas elaeocarpi TaxID=907779 RepID=A0ABV6JXZ3_9PROT
MRPYRLRYRPLGAPPLVPAGGVAADAAGGIGNGVPVPPDTAGGTAGQPAPMPTQAQLRDYLRGAGGKVGKSELVRHFRLHVDQRPALREMLRVLRREGTAAPAGRRSLRHAASLPETAVVEVFGTDPDGDPLARPVNWQGESRPIIYMHPERKGQPALAPGERVLARLKPIGRDRYEGRTVKRLPAESASRVLGVFQDGRILPVDRRARAEWTVPEGESLDAANGELVLAEPLPSYRLGLRPARVVERLGPMGGPRAVSLVCIHLHNIPDRFDADTIAEAEAARAVTAEGREDLRNLPLITIDGEDARDFDDAVHAEATGDGWAVTVAIADVAHYVRPGSALDRTARARGNSVYFPDRVVPMLPEALSNGWCSLKPDEDRGCLFVRMEFDTAGTKRAHRVGRGIMRSHARMTYEAVQASRDAGEDRFAALYGAFAALTAERDRRGTLDLDLPERRVFLDAEGRVEAVRPRARLDSHRLIEEFMVAANVCAAEELERLHQPCLYRVHDRPADMKLEALRQFLQAFELELPPGNALRPRDFARILDAVRDRPEERLVDETVLRAQSQAEYSADNIGHFGLALSRYAHFTSPIRRYADLVVHRAVIAGLRLGRDGITPAEAEALPDTAEAITRTERRAAAAERDAVDRYLAAFMADHVGATFEGRVSGVTRSGLFVTLDENGASGIVPLRSLPDDRWEHDAGAQRLVGRHTGLVFSLAQPVELQLAEAIPLTGSLFFHLLQGSPIPPGGRARPRGARSVASRSGASRSGASRSAASRSAASRSGASHSSRR